MIREFVVLPDRRIRQLSSEIISFDKHLRQIIEDLISTALAQKDPVALGLAAPQIGITKRVFAARVRNKFKPFVNPKIIKSSKTQTSLMEGCFSVTGIYGSVIRPAEIDITAFDAFGKMFTKHYKGLSAKIIQHEFDHLNGILFIDYVKKQNGKLFKVEKNKKGHEELIELPLISWENPSFGTLK